MFPTRWVRIVSGGGFIAIAIVVAYLIFSDPLVSFPAVAEQGAQISNRERREELPATVLIAGRTFTMRVADTDGERAKGLQHVESLGSNEGMVFLFEGSPAVQHFWNKNTLVHLHVVWVRDDIIIGVDELLPEPTNGRMIVSSPERVNAVLEIPADAGLEGITPGARIEILR